MITRFNRENHVKNLPDAYAKTPDSNNAKILEVEKSETDRLREEINAIYDSLDLDLATGQTLDLYGEMLGQERGPATDEQYRALLKSRITRNLAGADHNSIVNAICITFGCDPAEVLLTETDGKCEVSLEGVPFDALNRINLDVTAATQIIERLVPAGVTFSIVGFAGSFEFGGTDIEYDTKKGFADTEQTIGGTLGYIPDNGKVLPV